MGNITIEMVLADVSPPIHRQSIYVWCKANPEWHTRVVEAKRLGIDRMAVECLAIAENTPQPDQHGLTAEELRAHRFTVKRANLMIRTRIDLIKCWDKERYGDYRTIAGDPDKPLNFKDLTDEEVNKRFDELMKKRGISGDA
jgi:hypothetical protein